MIIRSNIETNCQQFPKDDEYSIQQSCGTANLEIYYSHQFIQNEHIANPYKGSIAGRGVVTTYAVKHTPLLKNTTSGIIYYRKSRLDSNSSGTVSLDAICTFSDKDGTLILSNFLSPIPLLSGFISNCDKGIIELTWNCLIEPGDSVIVLSYEYNLECREPIRHKCPKCNHEFYDNHNAKSDDVLSLQQLAKGTGTLDLY